MIVLIGMIGKTFYIDWDLCRESQYIII